MTTRAEQVSGIFAGLGIHVTYVDVDNGTTISSPDGHRPLHEIARDIRTHWARPYFGAVPYLEAMASLSSITDRYYEDDAVDVVSYFLANASSWRGDDARRVKAELNALLKGAN